jgi:hypothetical protein
MIVRICGLVSGYAGQRAGQTPETHDIIRTADFRAKSVERCEQPLETAGENLVSPINGQSDSNLKNPKVICLEKTDNADMYPFLAGHPVGNASGPKKVAVLRAKKYAGREMSEAHV